MADTPHDGEAPGTPPLKRFRVILENPAGGYDDLGRACFGRKAVVIEARSWPEAMRCARRGHPAWIPVALQQIDPMPGPDYPAGTKTTAKGAAR